MPAIITTNLKIRQFDDTDPSNPSPQSAWVRREGLEGEPIGLLLSLTSGKGDVYKFSYQTRQDTIRRVALGDGASIDVEGHFAANVTVVESLTFTADDDHVLLVNDTVAGGEVTITLPAAKGAEDRIYHIKKIGSTANVVIDANGTETIDDGLTATLTTQFESIQIASDGSNWFIV